jgi:hypothetical protein
MCHRQIAAAHTATLEESNYVSVFNQDFLKYFIILVKTTHIRLLLKVEFKSLAVDMLNVLSHIN